MCFQIPPNMIIHYRSVFTVVLSAKRSQKCTQGYFTFSRISFNAWGGKSAHSASSCFQSENIQVILENNANLQTNIRAPQMIPMNIQVREIAVESDLTCAATFPLFLITNGRVWPRPTNKRLNCSTGWPRLFLWTGLRTVTLGKLPSPNTSNTRALFLLPEAWLQSKLKKVKQAAK